VLLLLLLLLSLTAAVPHHNPHIPFRTADAVLLVFAVDDPRSFDEAQLIYDEVRRTNIKPNAPVLLLANKCV